MCQPSMAGKPRARASLEHNPGVLCQLGRAGCAPSIRAAWCGRRARGAARIVSPAPAVSDNVNAPRRRLRRRHHARVRAGAVMGGAEQASVAVRHHTPHPPPKLHGPAAGSHALPAASVRRCPRRRAEEPEARYDRGMRAQVKNGRIQLDEPTDLPEGKIIELVPLDEVISTDGDDLDDEERAALHRSIDESIEDEEAGNVEDLSKIIAELRAQL